MSRSGFEGAMNITMKKLLSGNTSICLVSDSPNVKVSLLNNRNLPEKLRILRNMNESELYEIPISLDKNPINKKPVWEQGDSLRYCYEADPAYDAWVKFGEESVTFVRSVKTDFVFTNMTTLTSNAVQPSLNLPSLYDNLTGYWSFDTDAPYSFPSKFVPGMVGTAFNATATFDYIQLSNNSQLNFSLSGGTAWPLNQSFSLAVWVNSKDNCQTNNRGIVSKGGLWATGYALGCMGNVGTMRYFFAIQNTSASNNLFRIGTDESEYGNWTHLVATYNGTDIRLYVNGTMQSQFNSTLNGSYFYTSSPLEIGRGSVNDNYQIYGSIDEVYIFNRSLSSGEAVSLWLNDGNVTKDLVAYFPMDNFSGGSILRSANSLHSLWGGYMGAGLALADYMNPLYAGDYRASTATACGTSVLEGISGAYQVCGEGDYTPASASGFRPTITDASNYSTVMLWYRDPTNTSALNYLYAETNTTSNNPLWCLTYQGGKFGGQLRNATVTSTSVTEASQFFHYDGKWHHAAFVRNYTGLYIIVDGVITGQTLDPTHFSGITGLNRKTLGKGLIYTAQRSPGYVDEVMTFNTSLSLAQITNIMNNQSQRFRNLSAGLLRSVNVTERGIDNKANLSVTNLTLLSGTSVFGTVCGWHNETFSGYSPDQNCVFMGGMNYSTGDICRRSGVSSNVPVKLSSRWGNATFWNTGTNQLTYLTPTTVNPTNSLTAYMAFNPTTTMSAGTDDQCLMMKYRRDNVKAAGWGICYQGSSGLLEYWYGDEAEAWQYVNAPLDISGGTWHDLIVRLDNSTEKAEIWLDGSAVISGPYLTAETAQYVWVGWDGFSNDTHGIGTVGQPGDPDGSDAANNQFFGYIDEVYMTNSTLNADDMAALFAHGPRRYSCAAVQSMTGSGQNYTFDFDKGYTDMTTLLIGTTGGFWPLYLWGYTNVSLYNVTVAGPAGDTEPPAINYSFPPDATTIYVPYQYFYAGISEAGNCTLDLNGTNYTMSMTTPQNFTINRSIAAYGNYSWRLYCNDTAGNMNMTASRWIFGAFDITVPDIGFVAPTPNNETTTNNYAYVNVSASEQVSCLLDWNGTNSSMSTGLYNTTLLNMTGLASGNHTFRAWCWDGALNMNVTQPRWIYVNYTAPIIPPPNETACFGSNIIVPIVGTSLLTDLQVIMLGQSGCQEIITRQINLTSQYNTTCYINITRGLITASTCY